jgi:hypothetical protein
MKSRPCFFVEQQPDQLERLRAAVDGRVHHRSAARCDQQEPPRT